MIEVIGGRLYDTATAECLTCLLKSDPPDLPKVYKKCLHRTRRGAYFTSCEIAPSSIFVGAGGTGLKSLSAAEAAALLIGEGRYDLVYKYFGDLAA